MNTQTPVTVITGFLGSGKTTLLNHILTVNHGKRIAVIENEFGEVGIDDALVKNKFKGEEEIFEMNNGCICCTVRGDLIRILNNLSKHKSKFDYVLIETTGLADPAPVAQTFFVDEAIAENYRLDGIVTVVDAKHALIHLDEIKPEGVENESVEQVAFADRIILNKMDLVSEEEIKQVRARIEGINKFAKVVTSTNSKVDVDAILGIHSFSLSRITEEIDPTFLEDQEHQHDLSVTSVGFTVKGGLNMHEISEWISTLLKTAGPSLFRYKGILDIIGSPNRFVFQGVHMLFSGAFDEPWEENDKRQSSFVFIGRNLDREKLRQGFESCLAKPLRFGVGQKVKCRTSKGWEKGEIIKLWDEGNAYRISISSSETEVWAPQDMDAFLQAIPE